MSIASTKVDPDAEQLYAPEALIGVQIDRRYRIERVRGQGGMAVVYAGVHCELGLSVAIKVLDAALATDPEAVRLFLAEARTASLLSHPNIVSIFDVGCLPDGRPFLVMPMLEGSDLATLLLNEGPQAPKRVASLLFGAGAALDLIHERGLLHRDIKPENLMCVHSSPGVERVIVLDFGIASARLPKMREQLVDCCGTPDFMPPETIAGGVTDHRGDVYALATVAFELLTGCLPFEGGNLSDLFRSKLHEQPRSLSQAAGAPFSAELEAVLACGLATDPEQRPSSAGKLVRQLTAAAGDEAPKLRGTPRPVRRTMLVGSGSVPVTRETRVGVSSSVPQQDARALVVAGTLQGPPAAMSAAIGSSVSAATPTDPALANEHAPDRVPTERSLAVASNARSEDGVSIEPPRVAAEAPALPQVETPAPINVWTFEPDSIGPPPPADDPPSDPAFERTMRPRGLLRQGGYVGLWAAALLALVVWSVQTPAAKQPAGPAHAASAERTTAVEAREPAQPVKSDFAETASPSRAMLARPAEATPLALLAAPAPSPESAAATLAARPAAPSTTAALARVPPVKETALPPPRSRAAPVRISRAAPVQTSRAASVEMAGEAQLPGTDDSALPVLAIRPREDPEPLAAAPVASGVALAESLTRDAADAMLRGDLEAAITAYSRALAADASYALAWRGRGLALERLGRRGEAAAAFKEFLRLRPNGAAAQAIERRLQALEDAQ